MTPERVAELVSGQPGVGVGEPAAAQPGRGRGGPRRPPTTGTQDEATIGLVTAARGDRGAAGVRGGAAAATIDFAELTRDRLPRVIAVVVGLSLLLLW